jgi:hypothetical protein
MKVISKFKIFSAIGWLLLSFNNCEVVYAKDVDCHDNTHTVCNNTGPVYNNYNNYNYIYNNHESPGTNTVDPTTSNDVVVGNLKFKLLGCRAREDKVQCDIQVLNPTSLDRTLFVASQQISGIRSTAFDKLGITTMIDEHGASYTAQAVSFANKPGGETGQSNFTVYSNTPTKLSVFFTGVENPATVKRLDLLVGENTSSGLVFDKIKYPVKPKVQG